MPPPDSPQGSLSLEQVAERLSLTLDVDANRRLLHYLDLLQRWNATYNLTAVRDPAAMRVQHLHDCLAVIGPLRRELDKMPHVGPRRLLDVGSGGGLPGVVIAVLCPRLSVVCVDSVGKKAAFVRQAGFELGLSNLRSEHARVEQLALHPFDLIVSRAFSSLPDFVALTRQHLAEGGVWMAMKGRRPDDELAALPAEAEVFHVEPLAVPELDGERCLVWMRPAARTP
jgi:16S rRNA (guanine527-N7)-methyltransferase